jgi:RNA polymerase primary sigma factor
MTTESDGTRRYFTEAAATGLLTAEQEHKLALVLIDEPKDSPLWDAACRELIEKNLRLVISIAKHYVPSGIPLDDLIEEGNIGLIKAIHRFRADKLNAEGTPIRVSTYATWWIRQEIAAYVKEQGRMIRLPSHVADLLNRAERVAENLRETTGLDPTPDMLARELGIEPEAMLDLLLHSHPVASLDRPIVTSSEETVTLGDVLPSPEPERPRINSQEINDLFDAAGLDPREKNVLKIRFGIGPVQHGRQRTLEETGEEWGLTRERIRQLEKIAMAKLRRCESAALRLMGLAA